MMHTNLNRIMRLDLHTFIAKKKENHIKKPLNAFMLYMKEMRPVVQAECTLKESAAINQILGRRVRFSLFHFSTYVLLSSCMRMKKKKILKYSL